MSHSSGLLLTVDVHTLVALIQNTSRSFPRKFNVCEEELVCLVITTAYASVIFSVHEPDGHESACYIL